MAWLGGSFPGLCFLMMLAEWKHYVFSYKLLPVTISHLQHACGWTARWLESKIVLKIPESSLSSDQVHPRRDHRLCAIFARCPAPAMLK